MKAFLTFFFLSLAAPTIVQIQRLDYSTQKVGFFDTVLFDDSRPAVEEQSSKEKGRIIPVNVWYPAHSVMAQPNTFSDYVHLAGRELTDTVMNDLWKQKGIDKYFEWPASLGADKSAFTTFLLQELPMKGYRHAKFSAKDYPIILLMHGFTADFAYSGEYLASHGSVVLHIPTKGTLRYELDYEEKGLETQVLDYEFVLSFLKHKFSLSAQNIATIGFSFGGQSALAVAMRNQNVKAVISLDGGIGSDFGGTLLSHQSFYDSTRITAPILHLYNPKDPYTNLRWLNRYTLSSRCYIALRNVEHGYFTSFGLLRKTLPDIMSKTAPNPGDAYEVLMLLSREFIQAYFSQAPVEWETRLAILQKKFSWISEPIVEIQIKKPAV